MSKRIVRIAALVVILAEPSGRSAWWRRRSPTPVPTATPELATPTLELSAGNPFFGGAFALAVLVILLSLKPWASRA